MANIEVSLRNGCAIVILNRPEIRNAFDDSLIANLAKTLKKLDAIFPGPGGPAPEAYAW